MDLLLPLWLPTMGTCSFEGHGQKAGPAGDEQDHHGHQEALVTLPWPGERAGEAFFRKLG